MFREGNRGRPPQAERAPEEQRTPESVRREIASDLKTGAEISRPLFERLRKAATPESLRYVLRRTELLGEKLKRISFMTLLANAELSGYAVTEQREIDGPVEYTHTDPETNHIINVIAGKEKLTPEERLIVMRKHVEKALIERNAIVPDDFSTLDEVGLKETARRLLYGDLSPQRADKKVKQLFWHHDGGEYSQEYYDLIWQLERENGSPKVKWLHEGTPSADQRDVDRPYFDPFSNTMYVSLFDMTEDFVSEMSHAKQLDDGQLTFTVDIAESAVQILSDIWTEGISFRDAQLRQYRIEGSLENKAHSTIEPNLKQFLQVDSPDES